MRRHFATLSLVSLVAVTAPVSAQDATAEASDLETEARARFSLGELYYSQARFAEAAVEFEAAYAIHPHPLLLHNIYLARRDLGDLPGAADALRRYLAAATDLSGSERRLLEGRLQTMERQLAEMTPDVPDETVTSDAPPIDSIDPGEALADPDSAPPPARSGGGLGLAPGAVTLGVGAAGLVGAAIAAGVAEGVRGERDSMCTLEGGACPAGVRQDELLGRFNAARDAAWGLLVAGGTVAAIGGVLLGVGASEGTGEPEVTAACDGTGCFASVGGTF